MSDNFFSFCVCGFGDGASMLIAGVAEGIAPEGRPMLLQPTFLLWAAALVYRTAADLPISLYGAAGAINGIDGINAVSSPPIEEDIPMVPYVSGDVVRLCSTWQI